MSQTKTIGEKIKLLRRLDVELRTGLKRSTLYEMMQANTFPKPINLTKRAVAWVESEIEDWIKERFVHMKNEDIYFVYESLTAVLERLNNRRL